MRDYGSKEKCGLIFLFEREKIPPLRNREDSADQTPVSTSVHSRIGELALGVSWACFSLLHFFAHFFIQFLSELLIRLHRVTAMKYSAAKSCKFEHYSLLTFKNN